MGEEHPNNTPQAKKRNTKKMELLTFGNTVIVTGKTKWDEGNGEEADEVIGKGGKGAHALKLLVSGGAGGKLCNESDHCPPWNPDIFTAPATTSPRTTKEILSDFAKDNPKKTKTLSDLTNAPRKTKSNLETFSSLERGEEI
eukprot:CAMPEP_0185726632 /NCGR_PEP_ID=MMETSP1171-20130828/2547_1 /TAXON_ID=374046 /ORGANISM="Helicotheca tamensis, Strain CCMP826" /LENGTH=141 /DNA_ID=CAMNT_0028395017 /DNA_START=12 /DNA_END=435 /DNA_ORIENTATION=-